MTDKPTPTDAELEALLLDKLPASKHYIRPVIEKMVAAMQAAIDKWGQPAPATQQAAPQPAPAPLSDDVVKDAARYQWLFGARTEAQAASVSETVFKPLPQDEVLSHLQGFYMSKTDVDALVDAARKQ